MLDRDPRKLLFERALESKLEGRRKAAALPFSEKIARMLRLQANVQALRAAPAAAAPIKTPPQSSTLNRWVLLHLLDPGVPLGPVRGASSGTSQWSSVDVLPKGGPLLQRVAAKIASPAG